MIISLAGTFSVGKTTLLNTLKKDNFFNDFLFIESNLLYLKEKHNLKNYKETDDQSQIFYFLETLKTLNYCKNTNAVIDRSILDVFVFTYYQYKNKKILNETIKYLYELLINNYHLYDYIFYLEPVLKIENKKERIIDYEYRKELDNYFKELINTLNFIENKIYFINEINLEDRVKKIKKIIKK